MALARRATKLSALLTLAFGAGLVFAQPAAAVWPGENGKIVFWKALPLPPPQMSAQIYSMNNDGSNQVNLSAAGGGANQIDIQPSVSPNGKKIAFTRAFVFPGPTPNQPILVGQILTMRIDGSHQTNISNDAAVSSEVSPSWTEDGSSILFVKIPRGSNPGSGGSIWIRRANGQGLPRQLTTGTSDSNPAMSPDGDLIAFSRFNPQEQARDIYVMKADGTSAPVRLVMGAKPDWSPDSKRLVYGQAGFGGITVVNVSDPSQTETLTTNQQFAEAPVWSPDGDLIAFIDCTFGPCQIAVMSANGQNQHDITHDPRASYMKPDWQRSNGEGGENSA